MELGSNSCTVRVWINIDNVSFIIKPTRCTNFTNLFWHETLHVSDSSFVHLQEFIHCTMLESCLQTCTTYTIADCTVNELVMMEKELSETCRVSCQNEFVKLVHLVGFIIKEIYYYTWSHERKTLAMLISAEPCTFPGASNGCSEHGGDEPDNSSYPLHHRHRRTAPSKCGTCHGR